MRVSAIVWPSTIPPNDGSESSGAQGQADERDEGCSSIARSVTTRGKRGGSSIGISTDPQGATAREPAGASSSGRAWLQLSSCRGLGTHRSQS